MIFMKFERELLGNPLCVFVIKNRRKLILWECFTKTICGQKHDIAFAHFTGNSPFVFYESCKLLPKLQIHTPATAKRNSEYVSDGNKENNRTNPSSLGCMRKPLKITNSTGKFFGMSECTECFYSKLHRATNRFFNFNNTVKGRRKE